MIYLTGDTHGDFTRLYSLRARPDIDENDTAIVLGDAGVNFYLNDKDRRLKAKLNRIGFKIFCIHGNHEERPYNIPGYIEIDWKGGKAYAEPEFENLIFAKDGEIYDLDGIKAIAIGGAYSVDKYYRLANFLPWFPSEQPDDNIKARVEAALAANNWKIDIVLSHTMPFSLIPAEGLKGDIDPSTVDNSTELWMDEIEKRLDYKKWFCGHFHCQKEIDKIKIMYKDITDLKSEGL